VNVPEFIERIVGPEEGKSAIECYVKQMEGLRKPACFVVWIVSASGVAFLALAAVYLAGLLPGDPVLPYVLVPLGLVVLAGLLVYYYHAKHASSALKEILELLLESQAEPPKPDALRPALEELADNLDLLDKLRQHLKSD